MKIHLNILVFAARMGRYRIPADEIAQWLKKTPALKNGSNKFFRNLHNRGKTFLLNHWFIGDSTQNR